MADDAILATVGAAVRAGISVVPPQSDGSKRPVIDWADIDGQRRKGWEQWQRECPSKDRLRAWYRDGDQSGVGFVCGRVSGDLELFEFDCRQTYEAFLVAADAAGLGILVERVRAGYEEETPGGGVHWFLRCAEIGGNEALARRLKRPDEMEHEHDKVKKLIETRGEGGYAVVAPSNGRVHPTGGAYRLLRGGVETIPTITPEEREALLDLARSFDRMKAGSWTLPAATNDEGHGRPGDDFNQRGDWRADVMEPADWTFVHDRDGHQHYRRPGKRLGTSATVYTDIDRLHVFTSSSLFDQGTTVTKFYAYAVLHHGGDTRAAAAALRARGYGGQVSEAEPSPAANPPVSPALPVVDWPTPPAPEAFHGLAGEIVRAFDPETEADPVAMLLKLLAVVGNIVGAGPHWRVSGRPHGLRIYPVLVGPTSKGRKGTTWGTLKPLIRRAAPQWLDQCTASGLSSGEGLLWAVRDAITKQEPVREGGRRSGAIVAYEEVTVNSGVTDKRLCVIEEEFASTLKVMSRESNILSAVIRQAWDDGDLRTLTKNSPAKATGAHITIIGHITQDKLLRYLDNTEAGNGFANRFAWACVRRSKELPDGGEVDEAMLDHLAARLSATLEVSLSIGLMERDAEAGELWRRVYGPLSEGGMGLLGAVTSRAEAQVMRLAAIYALLDRSATISGAHLRAAVALWDYLDASARYIFGDALGDPVADGVLTALRQAGELTRTEIRDLFGRNVPASRMDRALGLLLTSGKASREMRPAGEQGGRPAEVWRRAR